MSLLECAGSPVLSGRILMPSRGAWVADLKLDTSAAPSGSVSIEADGGVTLNGTVTRAGVYVDVAHVRVVGGAGGLSVAVKSSWRNAQLRDPLGAVLSAGKEKQAQIDQSILGVSLSRWSVTATVAGALGALAVAAGDGVTWRVLSDGSVWMGRESWPAASLREDDAIAAQTPESGLVVVAGATPWITPGVDLSDVGHVGGVEHYVTTESVRSYLWLT